MCAWLACTLWVFGEDPPPQEEPPEKPKAAPGVPPRVVPGVPPRRPFPGVPGLGPDQFAPPVPVPSENVESARQFRRDLERGRTALAAQRYEEAVKLFQNVLNSQEDHTYLPENREDGAQQSLKIEALRLLGELVASGRREYETQFGPLAQQKLDAAIAEGTSTGLEMVVRQYFHTQAGYEATFRLACDHFDHGRWLEAALTFERLRQTKAAVRFDPELALKSAVAWYRSGGLDEALVPLRDLKARGIETVTIAETTLPLVADADWLAKLSGSPLVNQNNKAWLMVGGNVSRNASSLGTNPYLSRSWREDTISGALGAEEQESVLHQILDQKLEQAADLTNNERPSMIPASQPLVVGPLAVFRAAGRVRAVNLTTGQLAWTSAERDPLLESLFLAGQSAQRSPGMLTVPQLVTQRAWRDSTHGTLSSDGFRIFGIEESVKASSTQDARMRVMGFGGSHPADNRLVAYDAANGKMLWEIGAPSAPDSNEPFAGLYFLGPPMPLFDRLYCLAELNGEISLLCLRVPSGPVRHGAERVALDWSQTLLSAAPQQGPFGPDPLRRQCGLSPSYAGGILVCPTEEGEVVAFELATRALLWRYRYAEPDEGTQQQQRLRIMMARRGGAAQQSGVLGNEPDRWLDSLVTISGQHVVVAPRESQILLCLNLRDGAPQWRTDREKGLHVAGVHDGKAIVVGRENVSAFNLRDGNLAWAMEMPDAVVQEKNGATRRPFPSGRGFIGGDSLFLPLDSAEVAMIDLRNGRFVSSSRSREGRIAGNLIGTQNMIVSQGVDYVEGFPPFAALEAEIIANLEKNADDAAALALRGEILLQRGEVMAAHADFKRALKLQPDDKRTREVLVKSVLEGLRVDFAAYREQAAEIEPLISEPGPRAVYLKTLAQGMELNGERLQAFETWLKFVDVPEPRTELERTTTKDEDDAHIARNVRSDRVANGRMQSLYLDSAPADRKVMLGQIQQRFDAALEKRDLPRLRSLMLQFRSWKSFEGAPLASLLDQTRPLLIDLLEEKGQWLEAERWIVDWDSALSSTQTTGTETPNPVVIGRWAKLLAKTARMQEAVPLLLKLEGELAEATVAEGMTGKQLAAELRKAPELQPEALRDPAWNVGRIDAERLPVAGTPRGIRGYLVPVETAKSPFFSNVTFELDSGGRKLMVRDGYCRARWQLALGDTIQWVNVNFNQIYVQNHLVLLSLGAQLIAIDTLGTTQEPGPRILWRHVVSEGSNQRMSIPFSAERKHVRGKFDRLPPDVANQLAKVVSVTAEHVVLLRGDRLIALDAYSGQTVWSRDERDSPNVIFGDESRLFTGQDGSPESSPVLRMQDGSPTAGRLMPDQLVDAAGHKTLSWHIQDPLTPQVTGVFTQTDIWTGKVLWSHKFHPESKWAIVDHEELVVLEPAGRFSVLDMATGKLRIDNPSKSENAADTDADVISLLVFRSTESYTVIANVKQELVPGRTIMAVGTSQVATGTIYGFDRTTGRRLWATNLEPQCIDPNQPAQLPILTFTTRMIEVPVPPAGAGVRTSFNLSCLDRRTGRFIYDDKRDSEPLFFVEYDADPEHQLLELKLYQSVLKLKFTNEAVENEKPPEVPEEKP